MTKLTALDDPPKPSGLKVAPHQYRQVGGKVLITNDAGRHALLSEKDYRRYLAGIGPGDALWETLQPKGFAREYLDFRGLGAAYARSSLLRWEGPWRHVIVIDRGEDRMSLATLKDCLDQVYATPAPRFEVELVAVSAEKVKGLAWFAAAYLERLAEWSERGSGLELRIEEGAVSKELAEQLSSRRCGARRLIRVSGSPAKRRSKDASVSSALCRIAADAEDPAGWLDSWRAAGYARVRLDPGAGSFQGDGPERFVAFYAAALDRMIEGPLREDWTTAALGRIFAAESGEAPRFDAGLDLVSELAYDIQGKVYTSEAGMELAAAGNRALELGRAGTLDYSALKDKPAAVCVSAVERDFQPLCFQCVYKPFCSVAPAGNLALQGTLWGQMPSSTLCDIEMGRLDALFSRLGEGKLPNHGPTELTATSAGTGPERR